MYISLSKDILINNINIVSKAVSQKATLAILECILLTADESGFRMLSNDLEIGIETSPITADIKVYGQIALEAKIFSEIVRRLPEDDLSIQVGDDNVTIIKSGKSEFKILGQPGDEFPVLPEVEKNNSCNISSTVFKNMIRQTIFSVSTGENNHILTGELLDVKDNLFNVVAIDGYRISYRKADISPVEKPLSAIVPSKALNDISKILEDSEDEITLYFTDNHILFNLNSCIVVSRLIEGEYLKYNQIFSEDYSTLVTVNRQRFLTAVERATLVSKEVKKNPVDLNIKDDVIVITSKAELGTSYEEFQADVEGSPLELSFNPKYLMDALKVIDDDMIKMQFTTSLTPCIIRPVDGGMYKYLILPLRLKS